MKCYTLLLVVLLLGATSVVGQEDWVVETAQGLVRGLWDDGLYSFRGIPYTEPPLGEFKYQAPRAPPVWEGIFEANRDNVFCPQMVGANFVGELDCLVLNVYTPEKASLETNPLPVMVFIHGGGFTDGTSAYYGPRHLVAHGVITVIINYRMGPTGYLCLKHELNPGNAGMKDKVAALRWVQQNIAAFGGDPGNVTIFGHSSGAVSVDLITLSPMVNRLFKRAITQSGAALAPWAINIDPIRHAILIAEAAGYTGGADVQGLMNFYLATDLESIVRATSSILTTDTSLAFTPCIEDSDYGQEKFLTQMPLDILRSGNYTSIPLISGVMERETYGWSPIPEAMVSEFTLNLETYLPADLAFLNDEDKTRVADRLRQFYFSDPPTLEQYYAYNSDRYFYISGARTVQERVSTSTEPVYFYEFKYRSGKEEPPAHDAELPFLIYPNSNVFADSSDQLVGNRMSTLWTNFAKFGNPTPEPSELLPLSWSPLTEEQFNYLLMDDEFSLEQSPNAAALQMWNEIYNEFY